MKEWGDPEPEDEALVAGFTRWLIVLGLATAIIAVASVV